MRRAEIDPGFYISHAKEAKMLSLAFTTYNLLLRIPKLVLELEKKNLTTQWSRFLGLRPMVQKSSTSTQRLVHDDHLAIFPDVRFPTSLTGDGADAMYAKMILFLALS